MKDPKIGTNRRPEARWVDHDCPKCGSWLVAEDQFGKYCCIANCGWTDNGFEEDKKE